MASDIILKLNQNEYPYYCNGQWIASSEYQSPVEKIFDAIAEEIEPQTVTSSDHFEKIARIFRKVDFLYFKTTENQSLFSRLVRWIQEDPLSKAYQRTKDVLINAALKKYDGKLADLYEIYVSCDQEEQFLNFNIASLFDKLKKNITEIGETVNRLIDCTNDNLDSFDEFQAVHYVTSQEYVNKKCIEGLKKVIVSLSTTNISHYPRLISTLLPNTNRREEFEEIKKTTLTMIDESDQTINKIKNLKESLDKLRNKQFHIKYFIDQITAVYYKRINSRIDFQGFVWRVTNQEGVQHYCVGTHHGVSPSMAKAPLIDHAIHHSEKLVVETTCAFTNFIQNFGIDGALYDKARERGIAIEGLEDWKESLKGIMGLMGNISGFTAINNKTDSIINQSFTNTTSLMNIISKQYIKTQFCTLRGTKESVCIEEKATEKNASLFRRYIETISSVAKGLIMWVGLNYFVSNASRGLPQNLLTEIWQSGRAEDLPTFFSKEVLDDRNDAWLNKKFIVKEMRIAERPLCLAVGFMHFTNGNKPLLKAIKEDSTLRLEKGVYDFSTRNMTWEVC